MNNKKNYYVIGVSCGIDSVLSLRILLDVFDSNKIKAYFIDINSEQDSLYLNLIQKYFSNFNLEINKINLINSFEAIKENFAIKDNQTNYGNIKSKLRSIYLFAQAFENNALVLNTTNYDEYILGYFTKFGDSNGDVFLLNGLLKTHIYELAEFYNIPKDIIDRKPTSGLSLNDDETEFEFSYKDLDQYLLFKLDDKNKVNKIINRIQKNKHKQSILKNSLLKPYKKYKC